MTTGAMPRRQHERTAATRGAIVAAARELVAAGGYEATTIEDIARRAGVSKGALYHHFADKVEVLVAVYEDLEAGLVELLLAAAAAETEPVAALRVGCHTFLDVCLDPVFRRIALVDAPSALGWDRWRSIDARHGFGLLLAGLQAAADSNRIGRDHLEERAHLLLAALIEAALLVGRSDDPGTTRKAMGALIDEHIDGLVRTARRRKQRS
jgi:AcrR family transcriptional regulator